MQRTITEGTEQDLILVRLHGRRELNLVLEGILGISGKKNMVPVTGSTSCLLDAELGGVLISQRREFEYL